jgi:hypothetical protein
MSDPDHSGGGAWTLLTGHGHVLVEIARNPRTGRRVVYTVNRDRLFRHPAQEGHRVGPFLDLLAAGTTVTPGPDGD